MEIDAPTQPAGELGGCLRRPVCAPARRTARGLSWSTLAYFCDIVLLRCDMLCLNGSRMPCDATLWPRNGWYW